MMAPLSQPGTPVLATKAPGAETGPSPRFGWLRSPLLQGLLALALYLAAWLSTSAYPLVAYRGRAQLDQHSMDPNFYVWSLRWWPYAVVNDLNPMFTHLIGAPYGHSLVWVTTVPPIALLAAPLTLLAGPVVAFNLLSAIAPALSAWAAFVLCRRLTRRFWASLLAGTVFGFSAFEMNHTAAGQLNLTYSLLLPLLAYLVLVWWQGSLGSKLFVVLAALLMAVQFYLFLETFADLTALLVVALVLGFAVVGRPGRPAIARLARHLGLAYALAIVTALPYLVFAFRSRPPKLTAVTGLDVTSLVLPRPDRLFGVQPLVHLARLPTETSWAGYVGIPLLLLVILLAVVAWSSRLVRFLTFGLIFIVVASFGPDLYVAGSPVVRLPWAPLWNLPILRNAYPSRLMLFAYLGLAVATALWLTVTGKSAWLRWPLGLLVLAFVVLDVPPLGAISHTSVPAFISHGDYQRQLQPGETVVVVSTVGNAGLLWQASTGFYLRISGGYINQAITPHTDLPQPVQSLAQASPRAVRGFERFIRQDRVGAILLDARHEPAWAGIFGRMGLRGHQVGDVIVYRTHGCRTCRLLSRHQLQAAGLMPLVDPGTR